MPVRTMVVGAALVGAALTLPVSGQTGGAGTAAGTAVVNGKSVGFKHAYAYGYGDKLVSVLLADRPVAVADFKENFAGRAGDPVIPPGMVMGAWKSLHGENKLRGAAFTFKADKSLMLDEVMVTTLSDAFGVGDSQYTVTLDQLTDKRISGTIKTIKPTVEVGSYKFGLDVKFDAPVLPLPM